MFSPIRMLFRHVFVINPKVSHAFQVSAQLELMLFLAVCPLLIKPLVIPCLQFLADIISKIVYFFRLDDKILNSLFQMVAYISKIQCNESISCQFPSSDKITNEFGALPVATRCWADFSP